MYHEASMIVNKQHDGQPRHSGAARHRPRPGLGTSCRGTSLIKNSTTFGHYSRTPLRPYSRTPLGPYSKTPPGPCSRTFLGPYSTTLQKGNTMDSLDIPELHAIARALASVCSPRHPKEIKTCTGVREASGPRCLPHLFLIQYVCGNEIYNTNALPLRNSLHCFFYYNTNA